MKDPAKRLNWTQMDLFKEWVEIRFECFKRSTTEGKLLFL